MGRVRHLGGRSIAGAYCGAERCVDCFGQERTRRRVLSNTASTTFHGPRRIALSWKNLPKNASCFFAPRLDTTEPFYCLVFLAANCVVEEFEPRVRILQYEFAVLTPAIRGSSPLALDQSVVQLLLPTQRCKRPSTVRS
jgi:hypothetical protein